MSNERTAPSAGPATPGSVARPAVSAFRLGSADDPRYVAYEAAWRAYIGSPIWDTGMSHWTPKQEADLGALADAAHVAFWKWKSPR